MDAELLKEFVTEAREHLETVEGDILSLEAGTFDREIVNRLFRGLHTIKGAASFMRLERITQLSHALENVVGKIRSAEMTPDARAAQILLAGVDKLRTLLSDIADDSVPIEGEVAALTALLSGQATNAPAAPPVAAPLDRSSADAPPLAQPAARPAARRGPTHQVEEVSKESSVRIPLVLLDKLMNLASELVLVRNQNTQAVDAGDMDQITAIAQRLNVVTSELQASVMKTRMRPVGGVFNRFNRLVRDLAVQPGKEIELVVTGAEVELDKSIIEAIGDPMMHLVRNAVGHGIEPAEVRIAAGKSRRGRIHLDAFHRHSQVHICVEDDGRGMDPAALIEAAVQRELVSPEEAESMSDRDALHLVFAPGFSTSGDVTDLSGRGVGMDVVKNAFGRYGGVVDISSQPGEGTRVTIKLPLTLAIVPALIVSVGETCFALPQDNVVEVVWLHGVDVHQSLKLVGEQEVYSLRGKLLPVLRLSRLLGMQPTHLTTSGERVVDRRAQRPDRRNQVDENDQVDADRRDGAGERRTSLLNSIYILVVQLGEEQFGLLVDTIVDTEEIVVKALHEQLKSCRAFSGTTVLGDGRIAMILDVAALVEIGGLRLKQLDSRTLSANSSATDRQSVLVFELGGAELFAVPLRLVARVEEVSRDAVQSAGSTEYVEHGDGVIPLVRIDDVVGQLTAEYRNDPLFVIIPRADRAVPGVLANRIVDTVKIGSQIDAHTFAQPGVVGTSMIDHRLTLLIDLYKIIDLAQSTPTTGGQTRPAGRRVLLVEDSAFYASLIVAHLHNAGFEVELAQNGREALERLANESFDVVVSDIEMPVMGGLELARSVRRDPALKTLRMLAISAMQAPDLEDTVLRAGFDGFQSKLDQDQLLERLIQWQ